MSRGYPRVLFLLDDSLSQNWDVLRTEEVFVPELQLLAFSLTSAALKETLEDIVHGNVPRVHKAGIIEAVVPQLVEHQLVRGEIAALTLVPSFQGGI